MATFEEVFSFKNLYESAKSCCKGVRWKNSTQVFEINAARFAAQLHKDILNGTYKAKKYNEFDIIERGKLRHIKAMHIIDRCVQKCLCDYYLKPLLVPKLIYDNAASIKGRGTEYAIKRFRKHLTYHLKKHGKNGGILLADYHDYFGSVNHECLLNMLRKDISDDRLYEITKSHIESYDGDSGLGLGSETSQILSVYYVNSIDHYIKEKLHIKGYGRYMDDFYLIHNDIEYLKYCRSEIERLSKELGLTLNSKTKIVKLTEGFTFLKKRFYITDTNKIITRLSRKNVRKRREVIRKMFRLSLDIEEIQISFICWKGYASHYDTYYTILKMEEYFNKCSEEVTNVN